MKLVETSSLYVVSGCLKSPRPSNMSSKLSQNINYIIHSIFMKFEREYYRFLLHTSFIERVALDM